MPQNTNKIKNQKSRWEKDAERTTQNRLKRYMTTSGQDVPMLVTPDDLANSPLLEEVEFP